MREWLREIRTAKRMSEQQVADNAGIAQPFYHNIEVGQKNPSTNTAKRIGAVLDFDWTRFFDDDPDDVNKAV